MPHDRATKPSAALSNSLAGAERDALDWFVRRRDGLTSEEEQAFQAWLQADAAHPVALAKWQSEWAFLDRLPADELQRIRRRTGIAPAAEDVRLPHPASLPPHRSPTTRRAAVAVLALSCAGASWLAWDHWASSPVYAQSFQTPRGQQLDAQLPDGTRLRLDTATQAELVFYRKRRELRMPEGQVFLDVSADADRPFVVLAGRLRITVVGTRFSVRHTPGVPGREETRVTVEEGRVRVTQPAESGSAAQDRTVELTAGQEVAGDDAGRLGPVQAVSQAAIAAWREGRLSFHDTPLEQVIAEFERYGPTGALLRDPSVAALRVTGSFDARRFDRFASALPQVLPVRLNLRDGRTEIVSSASAP